jgi:hypothetical protein
MENELRRLEERLTRTLSEAMNQRMERILDLLRQPLPQVHHGHSV